MVRDSFNSTQYLRVLFPELNSVVSITAFFFKSAIKLRFYFKVLSDKLTMNSMLHLTFYDFAKSLLLVLLSNF